MTSTTALGHLEDLVEKLRGEATVERYALIEQRTQFRKAITDELGLPDATQDDILKAIRELRANVAEDARQLQELRRAFAAQRAFLEASGTRFRKEVIGALGLDDVTEAEILREIEGLKTDGAEDDRQLAEVMKERDDARAECLERTEERDEARAECLRLRSVRAELERLVGSLWLLTRL